MIIPFLMTRNYLLNIHFGCSKKFYFHRAEWDVSFIKQNILFRI